MTLEEAKQILIQQRPNRPRSMEQRKLQRAMDVAISTLEAYDKLIKSSPVDICGRP